jgi:TolB-like protein/class 3 adenylate cyclase/Tfp pilus assembly protein PilF
METEPPPELKFEIGHVLLIDMVGYSKLRIDDQSMWLRTLKEIIRGTQQVREAEAEGRLLRLPTGDGAALVFRNQVEAPVLCAIEITRALANRPELPVRMGIHCGPVSEITDLNEQSNIAGAGINIAQRVMDCGDGGHILLSKHVAEDLEQYDRWHPLLHDLGECEVKHRARVHVFNLYGDDFGNPEPPAKFRPAPVAGLQPPALSRRRSLLRFSAIAGALLIAFFVVWLVRKIDRSAQTGQKPANTEVAVAAEKSIAVLPFENLSDNQENAYFADGVQDEILTDLARIADLKVISRTSVIGYRDTAGRNVRKIGQELGVSHLLEGSVQRVGNRVRVNAQLVDARNDGHLWAQTYDRDLADVFAIQSEVAKAIADQLRAKLSPEEKIAIERPPTADVAAFDLYTRASQFFLTTPFSATRKEGYLQAIDRLNQAVVRDPSFFQAYCMLAHAHDDLYFFGSDHTPERLAQAEAAVEAAFRLRPEAGEAHLARAEHLYHGYYDYNGALAEIGIARRTLPNASPIFEMTGYLERRRGKNEEALRHLERALELDPRNFRLLQQIALTDQILRRFGEMAVVLDRALAIKPNDVETKVLRAQVDFDWKADTRLLHRTIEEVRQKEPGAIPRIANSMLLCAMAERDVAAAEAALSELGENPFGGDQMLFGAKFNEGVVARMAGDKLKARSAFTLAREQQEKVVQAQPNYGPAVCMLGLIDAALSRKEEALREGRRAVELLPVAKDSIIGMYMIDYLAVIAAWVGENELACEQLETASRLSGYGLTTYGQLKLSPFWDPLRGDPRFEKIVVDLAPKDRN